jgi:NAD+ synthase (glutamine-hydrolysing)
MTAGAVMGTGNEAEGEDGYSTYNGDHMSMYNVNGSLPKTLIISDIMLLAMRAGFENVRGIVEDILGQPISAELGVNQTTEAAVGDTELVDWFFFHFRKGRGAGQIMLLASQSFSEWSIADLATLFAKLTRAHARSQYKRDAAPGAPLLGSMGTSQRGILRLPSDLRAYDTVVREFDEFAKLAT